jgi:hypothetical protein
LRSEAGITFERDPETRGIVSNLSRQGAFVAVRPPLRLGVGDGMRLRFRPCGSIEVAVYARVRWRREAPDDEGFLGYGVEFQGVDRGVQMVLADATARLAGQPEQAKVAGSLQEKYSVQTEPGRVLLRIQGCLEPDEARDLRYLLSSRLDGMGRSLSAYVDAGEARPASELTLVELRRILESLGTRRQLCGVLLAKSAITMMQLRRVAREGGVGDVLACFEDEHEAQRFWQEIAS